MRARPYRALGVAQARLPLDKMGAMMENSMGHANDA